MLSKKKQGGKIERLAPSVLHSIREMMEDKFPLPIIRKRIHNKIPVTLLTDAVYFRNLKLKFEREKQKGVLPLIPESAEVENTDENENLSLLGLVNIAAATRALIAPTLCYEGVTSYTFYRNSKRMCRDSSTDYMSTMPQNN